MRMGKRVLRREGGGVARRAAAVLGLLALVAALPALFTGAARPLAPFPAEYGSPPAGVGQAAVYPKVAAEVYAPEPSAEPPPAAPEEAPREPFPIAGELLLLENADAREGDITHIVLHFMSNVVASPERPYDIAENHAVLRDYGASAHYIVDRQGAVYLAVPEEYAARHAGKGALAGFPDYEDRLDRHSVGIEILGIGTREEMLCYIPASVYDGLDPSLPGFTEEQYTAVNALVNDIIARHPGIEPSRAHVIGHDEYAPGRKTDPGALFDWSRLDIARAEPAGRAFPAPQGITIKKLFHFLSTMCYTTL
jgi:N-acetyl-anhydromuramyl-L-alanine amidase AmpD